MAVVRVNTAKIEPADSAQSSIATNSFAATTGNLIVVLVRCGSPGAVSSITDTAGNTYEEAISDVSQDPKLFIYYAKNITGHATNIVTVNLSPSAIFSWAYAIQYSGLDTVNPEDAVDVKTGTGVTDLISDPFSTTVAGVVVLGASQANFGIYTVGTDFTLIDGSVGNNVGDDFGGIEERITTGPLSSYTAHITSSVSNSYTLALVAFKAASALAGPSLFRGRGFPSFDDEEINRFEFWPAITAGAVIFEMPVVSVSVSVVAPAVTGSLTLTVPVAAVTATVTAPALSLGARTLTVLVITTSASTLAPLVSVGPLSVVAPSVTVPVTVIAPAMSLGAISLSVPVIVVTASVTVPSLQMTLALTVPVIGVAASVIAPQVSLGAKIVAVPIAEVSFSVVTPAVTTGTVSLTVPAITAAITTTAPSLTLGPVNLTVPVVNVPVTILAPALIRALAVPVVLASTQVIAPSVTAGPISLAIPVSTVVSTVIAPTIAIGGVLTAGFALVQCSVVTPGVSVSERVIVVPAISVASAVTSPTITLGPRVLASPVAVITTTAIAPTLIQGGGALTLTVPNITVSVTAVAPAVHQPSITPPRRIFVIESSQRTTVVPRELRSFKPSEQDRIQRVP